MHFPIGFLVSGRFWNPKLVKIPGALRAPEVMEMNCSIWFYQAFRTPCNPIAE